MQPFAHAPYAMPQLMRPRDAVDITVSSARAAIFATLFNNAVLAARACDAHEFQLSAPQLPPFVDRDFCEAHVRLGFEWSFTAEPVPTLHVIWPELICRSLDKIY